VITELLPCKICNNSPYVPTVGVMISHNHFEIICNDCGINVVRLSFDECAEIWNKLMNNE